MSILKKYKPPQSDARITHMEELMYQATTRPWKSVLNYHCTCHLEKERRYWKVGDNFQQHEMLSTILTNATNSNISHGRQGNFSSAIGKPQLGVQSNSTEVMIRHGFVKGYQRVNCIFTCDQYGYLMGENRPLHHICAKCWQAATKQSPRPETSETCPLPKVEFWLAVDSMNQVEESTQLSCSSSYSSKSLDVCKSWHKKFDEKTWKNCFEIEDCDASVEENVLENKKNKVG